MQQLEQELAEELRLLEYPPKPWVEPGPEGVLDVAIVGAGMAGLAAAFGLMREGILNICLFDKSPSGFEGPWNSYARMKTLRSGKNLVGPALDIPKLTFQAWYKAKYGERDWHSLYKIPTHIWMDYLIWYRKVLQIPIENDTTVTDIRPHEGFIHLIRQNKPDVIAKKVVLATGRGGFGGMYVPPILQGVPKSAYRHTNEEIDFSLLAGKHICIIGVGASAFDAARVALEHNVGSVTMLVRRKSIPNINKFASATYAGFSEGFCELADREKVLFIEHVIDNGSPPPFESIDLVKDYPNFKVLENIDIKKIALDDNKLILTTSCGILTYDFLLAATGFCIDGANVQELTTIYNDILLWKDRLAELSSECGAFPYLGKHFEFMEKVPGRASYLKDIYCYNWAALLSHGIVSGDIPNISVGASRLAKGIAADFFSQHAKTYYERLKSYVKQEFTIKS